MITVNAVVDVSGHIVVLEVVRVISAMTACALEDGVIIGIGMACRADVVRIAVARRELGVLRMVERSPGPGGGVVTSLARSREELWLLGVPRVRRVVVISLMASDASGWQRSVVVVDVAIGANARRHRVRTGQREGSVVVVEGRVGPDGRVMTYLAGRRVSGGGVNRIRRTRVILLVA